MRIGAVSNGRVTGLNHARRQIGVWIDDANNRQLRTNPLAQLSQPKAVQVAVITALAGVGPVRRHQQAVEWSGLFQGFEHQPDQFLTSFCGDGPRRRRGGVEDGHGFHISCDQALKESADLVQAPLIFKAHFFAC